MNTERTISIRKRVHFDAGFVSAPPDETLESPRGRDPQLVPAGVQARDITCTITVDVPVLTRVPVPDSDDFCNVYDEIEELLHERGFRPEDEIGILARLVGERWPFRKRTGEVVYTIAASSMVKRGLLTIPNGAVLGFTDDGGWTLIEGDTTVVVCVRDVLPGYQPLEVK